jgi:hypothetical protein
MKTYGGVDLYIHIFLTSTLAGVECSASSISRFTPGERAPCTGGWVDLRDGLDDVEKKKFLTLLRLEHRPLDLSRVHHDIQQCL